MESLSKELAHQILLHLNPGLKDIPRLLLVSRSFRRLFRLSPADYKLARRHLQRHGDFETYDASLFWVHDDEIGFHFYPFVRLPMAYSLAYLSWRGVARESILSVFHDILRDNSRLHPHRETETAAEIWDAPLRYPKRVETFLRKAIELDIPMVIDSSKPFIFWLVAKLDSVDLMEAIIGIGLRGVDQAETVDRRNALELAAMHGACFSGAASVAKHLLSISSVDLRHVLYKDMFPLYTLAVHGHANVMQVLFDPVDGVAPVFDVDRKFKDKTPLEWAVESSSTSAALFLLEHGADINKCDLLLTKAIQHGNVVLDEEDAEMANYRGVSRNVGTARVLVEHGAAIDETDEYGLRPIHYTILYFDLETFELLLSAGADPIAQDVHKPGFTLLHFAAAGGRLPMVEQLYEIEAVKSQVYKEVGNGVTVMMYAAFHWRLEVVEWLLEHGGWAEFVNARDAKGRTALTYATLEVDRDEDNWMVGTPEVYYHGVTDEYDKDYPKHVEELLKRYGAEH
ncbi:hypothetical protein HDU96_008261 [Phlyctochytrium bullatum]|nr:hypothetical protein HDU96_008261 [Phlyctochytrium bullatum]